MKLNAEVSRNFFASSAVEERFQSQENHHKKRQQRRENVSWHEGPGAQGSKASSVIYFWPPLCSHIIRTWSKPPWAPNREVAAAVGWHFQVHPNTRANYNYPCIVLGAAQVEHLLTTLYRWGGCGTGLKNCKTTVSSSVSLQTAWSSTVRSGLWSLSAHTHKQPAGIF